MKKMYEQPLLKRNKAKMDLCILQLSLDKNTPAEKDQEPATKRRNFLEDDDADWNLGI
jgi:hypothetical protein